MIQPVPAEPVLAGVARLACRTQGARIPFTRELLQASLATDLRAGGIPRLLREAEYIVADRQRSDEQYYYSTGSTANTRTGGPVHTSAGFGRITGYFWCVKGQPAAEVALFENLYRLLRKVRTQPMPNAEAAVALEYILWSLDDFGANQFQRLETRFPALDHAIDTLERQGITVNLPANL